MKILPEHIDEIDAFYKARSEADESVEVPDDVWKNIEAFLPNGPVETLPNNKGKGPRIPYRHIINAFYFIAGITATVLYYEFDKKRVDTSSDQIQKTDAAIPSDKLALPKPEEKILEKADVEQPSLPVPQTKVTSENQLPSKAPEPELPNQQHHDPLIIDQPNQGSNQNGDGTNPQSLGPDVPEQSSDIKSGQDAIDFYEKYSKKVMVDSSTKKLFIPKK